MRVLNRYTQAIGGDGYEEYWGLRNISDCNHHREQCLKANEIRIQKEMAELGLLNKEYKYTPQQKMAIAHYNRKYKPGTHVLYDTLNVGQEIYTITQGFIVRGNNFTCQAHQRYGKKNRRLTATRIVKIVR